MEINITEVAATRTGAALLRVRSVWTSLAAAGVTYVPAQNPALAAMRPDVRCGAFRHVPAPTMLPPMNIEPQTVFVRKQTNVHQTRIGAGSGALGSPPEREPA
jgi:hypothetical protein